MMYLHIWNFTHSLLRAREAIKINKNKVPSTYFKDTDSMRADSLGPSFFFFFFFFKYNHVWFRAGIHLSM